MVPACSFGVSIYQMQIDTNIYFPKHRHPHSHTHIYGVINIVRWICIECLSVLIFSIHAHDTIRYDMLYMVYLYVQKWYTSERHDIIKRIESRFLRFFVSIHIPILSATPLTHTSNSLLLLCFCQLWPLQLSFRSVLFDT